MNFETIVKKHTTIYNQLQKELRWKVFDKRVLMTIAATYVMNNQAFQYNRFYSISETIKRKAGFFSFAKSELRFTIATLLDNSFENPEEKVPELFQRYESLIKEKFKRSRLTYIAASILLTTIDSETGPEDVIDKAKVIYESMKKDHPFLTSERDYPLAIFLALQADGVHERTEEFYMKLNNNGFRKGNDLQLLSHILSIDTTKDIDVLVSQTTYIFDSFKNINVKQKTLYYPIMGMLALLPSEQLDMETVHAIYQRLNNQKQFKWQKDLNMMLAASFFVNENMDQSDMTEINMFTTLEAILQVQQAIIVSSAVAATASSSSSGSN